MSADNSANLPAPPAIHAHGDSASQRDSRTYGSPGSSFSGSLGESDPNRWSFPASQYRQSAVLEMGSAVPMEIVNPEEPKEIQIQRALDSLEGVRRGSGVHSRSSSGISALGAKSRQDELGITEERKRPMIPHKIIIPSNDATSSTDPVASQLGEPWSASTPSRSQREDGEPSSGQPPSFIAPLSPLNYLSQSRKDPLIDEPMQEDAKDSDLYTTAQESSGEKSEKEFSRREKSGNIASGSPHPGRSRRSPRYHSMVNWGQDTDRDVPLPQWPSNRPELSMLRQLIDGTDHSEDPTHLRSLSEPTNHVDSLHTLQQDPLQDPLAEGGSNRKAVGQMNSQPGQSTHGSRRSTRPKTMLPHELLQSLPTENEPGYPVRGSSRQRLDTVSPRLALEGRIAALDSEATPRSLQCQSPIIDESERHERAPRRHHRKSHSQITSEEAQRLNQDKPSRRRRNFTKKSIENMMSKNPTNYDIDDIGLPGPERVLLEKFIDSLSKLSIEVQMDDSKRDEGRRRLNNALRALEGWI